MPKTTTKKEQIIKLAKCCYNCKYGEYVGGVEIDCQVHKGSKIVETYINETCNLFKFRDYMK